MIPIRSTIRTEIIPYVNYTLLAVNILVFAYTLSLAGESLGTFLLHARHRTQQDNRSWRPTDSLTGRQNISVPCSFHENWLHIAGNLIFLYIFGNGN